MVKVLVTGFTGSQCKRQYASRSQLKVLSSHYSLVNCLLAMGYEVEQRPVTLGEDLTGYDEVIVYLWEPRSRVATHTYAALYAISQHPDCIFAFDDWQMIRHYKEIERTARDGTLFHPFILKTCKTNLDDVEPYKTLLQNALDIVTKKNNRLLICAYSASHLNDDAFGVHIITDPMSYPRERIFTFNPNPYNRNRTWEDPGHYGAENPEWQETAPIVPKPTIIRYWRSDRKRRADVAVDEATGVLIKKQKLNAADRAPQGPAFDLRWGPGLLGSTENLKVQTVEPTARTPAPTSRPQKIRQFNFASLVQNKTQSWLKKQGLVGDLKSPSSSTYTIGSWPVVLYGSAAKKQRRLTEDEMVRQITRDWACLLPAYEHAGSGWYRNRVLQCADAGSVLVGDEKELRVYYGNGYRYYSLTAKDVSEMSDLELRDVANEQRRCIYALHPLDRSVQRAEVARVLEGIVIDCE